MEIGELKVGLLQKTAGEYIIFCTADTVPLFFIILWRFLFLEVYCTYCSSCILDEGRVGYTEQKPIPGKHHLSLLVIDRWCCGMYTCGASVVARG